MNSTEVSSLAAHNKADANRRKFDGRPPNCMQHMMQPIYRSKRSRLPDDVTELAIADTLSVIYPPFLAWLVLT
jgi:hypothetical protein